MNALPARSPGAPEGRRCLSGSVTASSTRCSGCWRLTRRWSGWPWSVRWGAARRMTGAISTCSSSRATSSSGSSERASGQPLGAGRPALGRPPQLARRRYVTRNNSCPVRAAALGRPACAPGRPDAVADRQPRRLRAPASHDRDSAIRRVQRQRPPPARDGQDRDEVRQIHLGYVPIGGKYVGRRSPRAVEMIRFLGRWRDFSDRDPAAQIRALRGIAEASHPVLGSARRRGRLLPRPRRGSRPAWVRTGRERWR